MNTNKKMQVDSTIVLVTFGPHSRSQFMPLSDVQAWRKTLPKDEFILITQTDMQPDDLELLERSQDIVDRLEREIDDTNEMVRNHFKYKKQA